MNANAVEAAAPTKVPFLDLTAMSQEVGEALDLLWLQAKESSSFIGGPLVERFEREWASYCGREHAVGVANGTDAIELTLRAMNIGPGDEVIVPANTFIATAEAVVLAGATPRFADVDPGTLLATPDSLAAALTPRTAAVIIVELFGNVPRMDEIGDFAGVNGLALIEDAAQAHGATWQGTRIGSFGVASCFSFYPSKNLGAFGDGGSVLTDDPLIAARLRSLADHGRAAGSRYVHPWVGRNSRLDALQAAVLSVKLSRLDEWNDRRRAANDVYRRDLAPDLVRTVELEPGTQSAHHLNVVRVPDRDGIREALGHLRIDTGIHYPVPCHLEEGYRQYATEPLPNAERAASEILSLPMFPHLRDEQIRYVCDRLNGLLEEGHAGEV
ncbi:MAG: DegT/DnrJ/EryC1/StrS family aminotransferase [Actinomycetota bacterium]|nr:DegT/DnrJ/EryC1/StrS family aminotransferase [Actinomycetota bacterium]